MFAKLFQAFSPKVGENEETPALTSYEKGFKAFWDGGNNPFPPDSLHSQQWTLGHEDARRHNLR